MNKFQVILTLTIISIVSAEPPVLSGGYGYRRPSHSSHSGLHTSISHGISSFGITGNDIGSGVHYSSGLGSSGIGSSSYHNTNEGLYVDPDLLHKVKEILLQHENLEQSHRNSHHHHHISDTYGPPHLQYGVPHLDERIVGIELGHIRPSIQVAHLHQAEHHHHVPSVTYGVPIHAPSISYGVPSPSVSIPSGSYGPPSVSIPSDTYIPPSIHAPSASYGPPAVTIQVPSGSYGVPDHHHHH